MKLKFLKGNIADANVDAIVLPANTKLKEGTGASEAIFKAAGRKELTKICKKIGYCEMGSAVPTLGYNLPAKFIIHAVVPKWIDGNHKEYELLGAAYASALELADAMECKSMAFPLLASGNNGFDLKLALEIALNSIESYNAQNLECISIVIFGNHIKEIVRNAGFEVTILPRNLEEDIKDKEKLELHKKMLDDVKDKGQEFLMYQLKMGMEFFKDPKHMEEAIEFGVAIVKNIMKNKGINKHI